MAYTRVWTNNAVSDATLARDIDDKIDEVREDVQQRMDSIIGLLDADNGWDKDPVLDGVDVLSLRALKVLADTKPTINPTTGWIPKKSGAGTLADSSMDELTANLLKVTGRRLSLNSLTHWVAHDGGVSQNIAGGANSEITFSTEIVDSGGGFASSWWSTPASMAGLYVMAASVDGNVGSSTALGRLHFRLGGVEITNCRTNLLFTTQTHSMMIFTVRSLIVGDVISIGLANSGGVTISIENSYFCGVRLF